MSGEVFIYSRRHRRDAQIRAGLHSQLIRITSPASQIGGRGCQGGAKGDRLGGDWDSGEGLGSKVQWPGRRGLRS